MTPDDISAQLPSGFHDAFVRELNVDFAGGRARLVIDFDVGDPDASSEALREAQRRGTLTLTGLSSVTVEPPHPDYSFTRGGDGVWVDGGFETAPVDDGLVRLRFFVQTWNTRMMFTAKGCGLEWA